MSSYAHQHMESTKRKLRKEVITASLPFSSKAIICGLLTEGRIKEAKRELKRARQQQEAGHGA